MKFVLQVQGPRLPVDVWIAAAPIVIDRIRAIRYDTTGAAVVEGTRSDRLRLVDGRAGQVGSAYLLSEPVAEAEPASPVALTLVADDRERIQIEAHSTGEKDPMGASLELSDPRRPRRVSGVASMGLIELPAFLGSSVELAGEITLTEFNFTEEPQIRFDLTSKRLKVAGSVHLRPTAEGYEITVHAKPRGLARLVALGWPIIRRQVIAAAEKSIGEQLANIHAHHAGLDGPADLADRVWADIVADLTDR